MAFEPACDACVYIIMSCHQSDGDIAVNVEVTMRGVRLYQEISPLCRIVLAFYSTHSQGTLRPLSPPLHSQRHHHLCPYIRMCVFMSWVLYVQLWVVFPRACTHIVPQIFGYTSDLLQLQNNSIASCSSFNWWVCTCRWRPGATGIKLNHSLPAQAAACAGVSTPWPSWRIPKFKLMPG